MTTVVPATADRWEDVVAVMGTRGDPSRCWCQYFMLSARQWRSSTPPANRALLQQQVSAGDVPPGVLAYADGQPVGWCAAAAKSAYPRLRSSPVAGPVAEGVWSVTCFVVTVGQRRKGVGASLLAGAVGLARSQGAGAIEGYAVDPSARSSVSAAGLYHGTLSMYLAAGFVETARPNPARVRVRLEL